MNASKAEWQYPWNWWTHEVRNEVSEFYYAWAYEAALMKAGLLSVTDYKLPS